MPAPSIYRRKQTWYLRWTDAEGRLRRQSLHVSDRKHAEALRTRKGAELAGLIKTVADTGLAWTRYAKDDCDRQTAAGRYARTVYQTRTVLRSFGEFLSGRADVRQPATLAAVTPALVEDYRAYRLETTKAVSVNAHIRCLHAAFQRAVRRGLVAANPVTCGYCKEAREEPRVATDAEYRKLLDGCEDDATRVAVRLARECGLRRDEIVHLRWERVNLATGDLTVEAVDPLSGWRNKTATERKAPPMRDETRLLLLQVQRQSHAPYVVWRTKSHHSGRRDLGLMVTQAVRRAGVKVSLKHLRAACENELWTMGLNPATVAALMGHTLVVAMRHYVSLNVQAAGAIDAVRKARMGERDA